MVVSASYCHEYAQEFLNTTGVFAGGESGDFILPYAEIKLALKRYRKGERIFSVLPLQNVAIGNLNYQLSITKWQLLINQSYFLSCIWDLILNFGTKLCE